MKRILGLLMMLLSLQMYAEVTKPGDSKDTPVNVQLEKGNLVIT